MSKIEIGDRVFFAGYSEEVEEILTVGKEYFVVALDESSEDGYHLSEEAGGKALDIAYGAEVSLEEIDIQEQPQEEQPQQEQPQEVETTLDEVEEEPSKDPDQLVFKKTASINKLIKENGSALKAAEALVDKELQTEYQLGGILAAIEESAEYLKIQNENGEAVYQEGHKGFAKFCEDHLGIKYRKAQYLKQIYLKMTNLGIPESKYSKIGWTKLREAIALINEDNAEEILQMAKDKPLGEFKEAMRVMKVTDGDVAAASTVTMRKFTLAVHEDQGEVVEQALKLAQEEMGLEDNEPNLLGKCFYHITQEWVQSK